MDFGTSIFGDGADGVDGVKPIWRSTLRSAEADLDPEPLTAGVGVITSGRATAAMGVDIGLVVGEIGFSTCLVGDCRGVSSCSCSSSTSIRFGTPFETTGAKAIGAATAGSVVVVGAAAGMAVAVGAADEVGVGGFFIPKSRRSRSTAW